MTRIDPRIRPDTVAPGPGQGSGPAPGAPSGPLPISPELAALDQRVHAAHGAARRAAEQARALEDRMHFGLGALRDPDFGRALRFKRQLPGERATSFAVHHAAIMADFKPVTSGEITLLESFIRLDWEIVRHRALREAAIEDAARARIAEILQARDSAEPGRAEDFSPGAYWVRRAASPPAEARVAQAPEVAQEVEQILERLLDWQDETDASDAEPSSDQRALEAAGITPLGILASVLERPTDRIAWHDAQIARYEARRSAVLKDLASLRRTLRALR